jgi:two-component system chemotaxis response regulator CheY
MSPADLNVIIVSKEPDVARTLRMALRGVNVRNINLAVTQQQMLEFVASAEPHALLVYVGAPENDEGLDLMRFVRRSPKSPNPHIPIIACSPRRDLATVHAVLNAGGHEYVLFPASGDTLLKKIIAARTANRAFVEQPDYVGPDRRRH